MLSRYLNKYTIPPKIIRKIKPATIMGMAIHMVEMAAQRPTSPLSRNVAILTSTINPQKIWGKFLREGRVLDAQGGSTCLAQARQDRPTKGNWTRPIFV